MNLRGWSAIRSGGLPGKGPAQRDPQIAPAPRLGAGQRAVEDVVVMPVEDVVDRKLQRCPRQCAPVWRPGNKDIVQAIPAEPVAIGTCGAPGEGAAPTGFKAVVLEASAVFHHTFMRRDRIQPRAGFGVRPFHRAQRHAPERGVTVIGGFQLNPADTRPRDIAERGLARQYEPLDPVAEAVVKGSQLDIERVAATASVQSR